MEKELKDEILNILKVRSNAIPATKQGHLADISEEDLLKFLENSKKYPSPKEVFNAMVFLADETGEIYLDRSDGGIPNHRTGGNNHHYRYRIISINNSDNPANHSSAALWIIKDTLTGEYFFDGKKILIKSKNAGYIRIFDAVFSLAPQGGEVSYEAIIKQCKAYHFSTNKKAIQKALTGQDANFFRYVKDIPSHVDYGIPLFVAKSDGSALDFKNKR